MANVFWDNPSTLHTLSNDDLDVKGAGTWQTTEALATGQMEQGKWYWELHILENSGLQIGVSPSGLTDAALVFPGYGGNPGFSLQNNGSVFVHSSLTHTIPGGISYGGGDVIGFYYDYDTGKLWIYINNVVISTGGNPATGANPTVSGFDSVGCHPAVSFSPSGEIGLRCISANITYSPISGFLPLEQYSPPSVVVRNTLSQVYDLSLEQLRQAFVQLYNLPEYYRNIFGQIYSLRMQVVFAQKYGDMPAFRAALDQWYGDNPIMRRLFDQKYDNAFRYRNDFNQCWNMPEGLRNRLLQRYGIAEGELRALCVQQFDLNERDLLRAELDQLYVLAAGAAIVQKTAMSVVCAGVAHDSMINIFLENDEDLFYLVGELQFKDEAEYLQYEPFETEVVITVDGTPFHFLPEYPHRQREPNSRQYIVPLVSPTILLDSPHSKLTTENFKGMASVLVTELAAPFSVDWQLDVDWFIPAGILTELGESAISVIKKIVAAAGGVVQTSPAAELICRNEYPVPVPAWGTALPDYELTDQDDFFSIADTASPRPGWNEFFIGNAELAGDGLSMEIIQRASNKNEIRVRMLPWDDTIGVRLLHSGGSWVQIVENGIEVETIAGEQIEIIGGTGRLSKSVCGYDDPANYSYVWRQRDLGTLTLAEGGDVATSIEDNSLVDVTYKDRFFSFMATDNQIENVQFYPEVYAL